MRLGPCQLMANLLACCVTMATRTKSPTEKFGGLDLLARRALACMRLRSLVSATSRCIASSASAIRVKCCS
ncbi:hypothetical protein PR001_g13321 [Phytophthora rubi]|uniref:Secreted protein n=1 Tax=Phytophthora rubi TaxID=129364 RepID=A0A6A3L9I3_9STRA|nr:hypothetical protein PR002_g13747 [Phytophthora rubi]KAE9021695.1 hypothetical protein PR001_g13321 [Phytophthora rubi]